MDPKELDPTVLKRIPQSDAHPGNMRYLAQVDVDPAALEERWGGPDAVYDDFAQWVCYAFSPVEGEAFFLQREVHHPPAPGFVLSVTAGLFSVDAANRLVEALGVIGARVTQLNAEAAS